MTVPRLDHDETPSLACPNDVKLTAVATACGITVDTAREFGLELSGDNSENRRIVAPLLDRTGYPVANLFLRPSDTLRWPRVIARDTLEGIYACPRIELYNLHRVRAAGARPKLLNLIVTTGIPAVWHMWQAGYRSVVGVLVSQIDALTARQLIDATASDGKVRLLTGTAAVDLACGEQLLSIIAKDRSASWFRFNPDLCSDDNAEVMLAATLNEENR